MTYLQPVHQNVAGIFIVLAGLSGCSPAPTIDSSHTQTHTKDMNITVDTLEQILEAFNRHDLDAIMAYFSEDCTFDMPRGPEAWGQRYKGKAEVREALAGRFKGIPDVHYGNDRHWLSADGNMGVSEWTLTGTTTAGVSVNVNGCDLWEFRNGKVIRKNSYWKIVER